MAGMTGVSRGTKYPLLHEMLYAVSKDKGVHSDYSHQKINLFWVGEA